MSINILVERSKNLAYEITSLARCEDEPIAFCGAVQSTAGVLFVVDRKDLKIRGVSENWESVSNGQKASELLGRPITDILQTEDLKPRKGEHLCEAIDAGHVALKLPIEYEKSLTLVGHCHHRGDFFLIEFEFLRVAASKYPVSPLKDLVQKVKASESVEDVSLIAAKAIKTLSGFDRVMIYRFDKGWNGEVIAEAKEDRLETYLYLKYPHTDIPPQARDLFFQNQSRMIVDIESVPSRIISQGIRPGEIDLSYALTRAVSPIHVQYLSNMGVGASF